jgi:hypothetical protein
MLETPFDSWRKFFRKHNSKTKEFAKYAFEKLDTLSNWLIGLSIGAVSLLVSEFKDINKLLTFGQSKTIFLFLFISVICGIKAEPPTCVLRQCGFLTWLDSLKFYEHPTDFKHQYFLPTPNAKRKTLAVIVADLT